MRILQVIHQFPPYSSQGSEVYCCNLSQQLSLGDEVRVFHVSNTTQRGRRRLAHENHKGMAIYHCVDGAEYARIADWPNRFLRDSFQSVLKDYAPSVVHFHNFISLGDDLVSLASASGAAVVYTLHDFGLICPNTFLLRDDGHLCLKEDPGFFQDCCPILIRTRRYRHGTAPLAARLPSLARWRLYSRQHPQAAVRAMLTAAVFTAEKFLGNPRQAQAGLKRDFFFEHTRKIFRDADLFLAPSEFLGRRYANCGISPSKIVHSRYGMRLFSPPPREKAASPLRFGYIGALHPQKGIELLLEGFRGLAERASLHVYGSAFGSPISQSYWQRIRGQGGSVFFHGGYDNDDVRTILAGIDVIVVPSLWYENSPLTIQEAFIGGVPVITTDCGGMAELVRDGVNGLLFQRGNAADLRSKMLRLVDQPAILDDLRRGIPRITSIEEHAADMRARYAELLKHPRGK